MSKVTICIPTYRAESFVATAIESVLAQDHPDLRVFIAVDPAGDGTEDLCRNYAAQDPRITVKCNPERLGWVGNFNNCLSAVETEFFAFCMHDDHLHPSYVSRLLEVLEAHPDAVCANGAIDRSGEPFANNPVQHNASIAGPVFERALQRLTHNTSAYSLKDMHRSHAINAGLRLPTDIPGDYCADFPLIFASALQGSFCSVPERLYFKTYDAETVTGQYRSLPLDQKLRGEVAIRANLIGQIQQIAAFDPGQKAALIEAVMARPLSNYSGSDADMPAADVRRWMDSRGVAEIMATLAGPQPPYATPSPVAAKNRVRELIHSARQAFAAKDVLRALTLGREALTLSDELAEAHLIYGRALRALVQGDHDEDRLGFALHHATRATELNPSLRMAWTFLATMRDLTGDTAGAVTAAQKALDVASTKEAEAAQRQFARLQEKAARATKR